MATDADTVTIGADTTDEVVDTKTTEAETPTVETTGDTDWKAEADKWKELSRKNERSFIAAKDTLAVIKAENESLLKDSNEFAELKVKNLELRKVSIASKLGLPERLVSKISGDTDEELENDAKEMLEAITSLSAPKKPQPLALQGISDTHNQSSSGETARQKFEEAMNKKTKGIK